MKKLTILILILFSCIALLGNNFSFALAEENNNLASVIISKCFVYSEKDFSKKIEIEGEFVYLKHGDIVKIISEEDDFALIECDKLNFAGNKYVYKHHLSQNNNSQNIYPVFNGKLRRNAMLYDLDFKEIGVLKKNTRVYIYEGFEKTKYTIVQVMRNDVPYIGYIKTENIKPDGINGILIAGISIIAASVTIILSLVFIKKKNKVKKAKQNNQN